MLVTVPRAWYWYKKLQAQMETVPRTNNCGTGTNPPLLHTALRQQQPDEQPQQLVLDPQTAGLLPGSHIDRQVWRTPLELHCGGPHCTLG